MIPTDRAAARFAEILGLGGAVAIVADHHADARGVPATFLHLPTHAERSVGLLAWRYDAHVVVAGIRRRHVPFQFDLVVEDVFGPDSWSAVDDPVVYVTHRYLRGLERMVMTDPTQYLWGYARWGEEAARQALHEPEAGKPRS
jgi:lauroyl/myristoyl acyltransferase